MGVIVIDRITLFRVHGNLVQYPSINIFIDIAYLTAKIACLYKYTFVKRVNTYEKYFI